LAGRLVALFGVRGRIGRARYWLYVAAIAALLVLLLLSLWIYALSIPGAYENGGPTPFPREPLGIAGAVLWFALLALALAAGTSATIRRLHDRDMAWWWIVVFVLVPDLLYGGAQYLTENTFAPSTALTFAMRTAAIAISLLAFVELCCLRGTAGSNRFGPDPLRRSA